MNWGILGPESLSSLRRTRTLGLATVVRHYNELAVPGMGNVWFARQLYLALLGIAVAEKARSAGCDVTNIETANAVEALGCWLALDHNGWQRDARLRGATKLSGTTDISFARLRKRSAYVTIPMRMATVQPLRELGFVVGGSERFNAYKCTPLALEFLELAANPFNPYNRTVVDNLVAWVSGDDCVRTGTSRMAVSPLEPLDDGAKAILLNQLVVCGNAAPRRKSVLHWVEAIAHGNKVLSWGKRPSPIAEEHWLDLKTGGLFFQLRDRAVWVLDLVEACLGQSSEPEGIRVASLSDHRVTQGLAELRHLATAFLAEDYDVSPERTASSFCRECIQKEDAAIIRALVNRDGHVLRLSGDRIKPGAAFRGMPVSQDDSGSLPADDTVLQWPVGISDRVKNLFYIAADFRGELGRWLGDADRDVEVQDGE